MAMNITTIILIFTNVITLLTTVIQYCFKSKCSSIDLCYGVVHIDRNIKAENDIEAQEEGFYENYKKISNKEILKRYGTNPLTKGKRRKATEKRRSKSF
jgi:hypothetical protein